MTPNRSVPQSGDHSMSPVGTLERGLAILGLFTAERPEWTFRGLSAETGLPKATTRRLVLSLERLGWLEQDADQGAFVLGPRVLQSLYAKTSTTMLVKEARPYLERLAQVTTETALLATWGHGGPITLDMVSTPRHFKPFTSVGMVMRGLGTADAQVLMAYAPESVRDARLDAMTDDPHAANAQERAKLEESWAHVRDTGVAIDLEQWREGVCAVAAPVNGATGNAIASLSIVMPSERATTQAMSDAATFAQRSANDLSAVFGFRYEE